MQDRLRMKVEIKCDCRGHKENSTKLRTILRRQGKASYFFIFQPMINFEILLGVHVLV